MLILIVDTETTGLDTEKDKVIEVAAALLDTDLRCMVGVFSTLIHADANPAEHINHIPVAALQLPYAKNADLEPLFAMAAACDVIVAHNAPFDQMMLDRHCAAAGLDLIDKPWLDSATQLAFPKDKEGTGHTRTCRKLSHLAADYGIIVSGAHRALADVLILSQLIPLVENIEDQVLDAYKLRQSYDAVVSYDDREKARERGFKWHGDIKKWQKLLADDEIAGLPFPVVPSN